MDDGVKSDDVRMIIEIKGGIGDEIQITKLAHGGLDIEIEEPWAGSTETGFGATASVELSAAQANALIAWLTK